jgi:hypothetical protein
MAAISRVPGLDAADRAIGRLQDTYAGAARVPALRRQRAVARLAMDAR